VSEKTVPVQVWDAPVRVFHWGIVVLLGLSWLSESRGWMQVHFISGYTVLAALLFRIAWGFVGSETARFTRFLRSPLAGFRHLSRLHRREADTGIGHNAAGGWAVLLMLLLLAVQVGTGLSANDDISVEGPLAKYVGKDESDWLTHIHWVNFRLIELVVLLHVVAIVTYALVKRHDLVRPMITGVKQLPATMRAPRMGSRKRALVLLAFAVAIVLWIAFWL
jgi:cytochrome b